MREYKCFFKKKLIRTVSARDRKHAVKKVRDWLRDSTSPATAKLKGDARKHLIVEDKYNECKYTPFLKTQDPNSNYLDEKTQNKIIKASNGHLKLNSRNKKGPFKTFEWIKEDHSGWKKNNVKFLPHIYKNMKGYLYCRIVSKSQRKGKKGKFTYIKLNSKSAKAIVEEVSKRRLFSKDKSQQGSEKLSQLQKAFYAAARISDIIYFLDSPVLKNLQYETSNKIDGIKFDLASGPSPKIIYNLKFVSSKMTKHLNEEIRSALVKSLKGDCNVSKH
tara:strand:+ start:102 stop:926 length:825 start_codon:yes stop_codon:yes gene_type:complete